MKQYDQLPEISLVWLEDNDTIRTSLQLQDEAGLGDIIHWDGIQIDQ